MNFLRKLFRRNKTKFTEGIDYFVMPDIARATANSDTPWNICFEGRVIYVTRIGLPGPDSFEVDINAEILYGPELTPSEQKAFGDLCMEIYMKHHLFRKH